MPHFKEIDTWIFDLDDTLYSPKTGFAKHMSQKQRATIADMLNLSVEEVQALLSGLVERHGGAPFTGLFKEQVLDMEEFIQRGFDLDHSMLEPCDLSRQLLSRIKGRKIIFTNSPVEHVHRVLKVLGFEDVFDDVFDVRHFDFETKPKVETYQHLLKELAVNPASCVMVEDRVENLIPAKKLGMTTVYVHGNEEAVDNKIVDHSYSTLLDFLQDVKGW